MVRLGALLRDRQGAQGLAQRAYQQLRGDITRCSLAPGARITQAELVEEYGFSQAAIREALTRLNQDGLVEVIPREGYVISQMTLKQAQDLYETRLLVECEVARLAAARCPEAHLNQLTEIQENLTHWDDNIDQMVMTNSAFHIAVAEATGNERLLAMITGLHDELSRHLYLFYQIAQGQRMPPEIGYAHERLIEALETGDGEAAARATHVEIEFVRDTVLSALRESPSLLSVNLVPQ